MKKISTIGKRIEEGLKLQGMKKVDLAEKLGVCKSQLTRWCNDSVMPVAETFMKIAEILDVNEQWLSGYDCERERFIPEDHTDKVVAIRDFTFQVTDSEWELLEKTMIDERMKRLMMIYLSVLNGQPPEEQ